MKISEHVNGLIEKALEKNATCIVFSPSDENTKVYFKVDNSLVFDSILELELYAKILRFTKFKTRLDISITRYPQEGSYTMSIKKEQIDVVVSTIPVIVNECLNLRLLKSSVSCSPSKELVDSNYHEELEKLKYCLINTPGLYLLEGPTGCGKTTLINSIITELVDEHQYHIVTIENPIEIKNNKVMKMQINEEIGIGYPLGIKAALRQSPELLVIGEIRDEQTARNVYRAACNGLPIISTIGVKPNEVVARFEEWGFIKPEIDFFIRVIFGLRLINNKIMIEESIWV